MTWTQRIVLLVMGLGLLGVALRLIRRRRLREEYAVLWVCTAAAILVFAGVPEVLYRAADWMGLHYSVLMMLVCFAFLAAIGLHYSVVISRHSEREKDLTQQMALLKDALEKLRAEVREPPPPAAEPKPRPPALRT